MKYNLVEEGYIPLDKSWMIRMGVLDLKDGNDNSINFLRKNYDGLSNDLKALYDASLAWRAGEKKIPVGESGTLYRFLRMYAWKEQLDKEFSLEGTLNERMESGKICDDPDIINLSPLELLTRDNKTSQWTSASYLLGLTDKIDNSIIKTNEIDVKHPKLLVTYDAVKYWNKKRANGKKCGVKYDKNILMQAIAYLDMLHKNKMNFVPQQAEDYCFAYAFGLITSEEGESRWPSLRGHESDRISEMERVIKAVKLGMEVDSKDHRVVQAAAMLQKINNQTSNIKYLSSVNKSWPQFWNFLKDSENLLKK